MTENTKRMVFPMNLNSYLSSWWFHDSCAEINEAAFQRFMKWMSHKTVVKTTKARGWRNYPLEWFLQDMEMLRARGSLIKRVEVEHLRSGVQVGHA
jgi:hypothetical protein